jgi:protein-tyrosine phosphatase
MLLFSKSTRHKTEGTRIILLLIVPSGALFLARCSFCYTFAFMKILMVCLGNLCRSPLAEGILQDKAFKAGLNWLVESAGTNSYHTGDSPHPFSQKVAKLNGIDISKQRARRFVPEDFERYDKIYALAEDVMNDIGYIAKNKFDEAKIDLLMNELYPGRNLDVPDPYYGGESGYHEVYKLLDKVCEQIIEKASLNPRATGSSGRASHPSTDSGGALQASLDPK